MLPAINLLIGTASKVQKARIELKKQSPDFEVEIWASPIG
jgi:hypothetical protein